MLSISKNTLYKILIILICLFGLFLRLEVYFAANPIWNDEASLASSIISRGLFDFFKPLDFIQMAPPFFMMSVKFFTKLFGEGELSLRLIPLLSGILSVFLFYKLTIQTLKKPVTIVMANLLFAINYNLINFSQEFKQYSSDVLFFLIAVLVFSKININELNKKQTLAYSFFSLLLIFFSYPSFFVIAAFIIINLFPFKKDTLLKIVIYSIPIVISSCLYYFLMLSPAKDIVMNACGFYWEDGFITLNPKSISHIVQMGFSYVFFPNNFHLIVIFAPIIGVYLLIKENTYLNKLIFVTLFVAAIFSALHLYPLKDRLTLYLVPVILIFTIKPLDLNFKKEKILAIVAVVSILLSLYKYDLKYIKGFSAKDAFQGFDSKSSLELIAKNYKPEEIFVHNYISSPDYTYYKKYFHFFPTKTIVIDSEKGPEDKYFKKLDKFERNKTYWFYYPFDFIVRKKEVEYLKDWLKSKNIEYKEYTFKRSKVIHAHL